MLCTHFRLLPALLLCLLSQLPAYAAPDGDKEVLQSIVKAYSKNWDALRTWKGEATIEQTSEWKSPNEKISNRWKAKVKFRFDKQAGSLRWEMENTLVKFNDKDLALDTMCGIVHGGLLYEVKSNEGGNGFHFLHIRDGSLPFEEGRERFDPMTYVQGRSRDLLKSFRFYIDNIDNPKLTPSTIKREGSLAVHSIGDPGSTINAETYDLSKGGNIVLYYAKDPIAERTAKTEYVETSGVYLPSLVQIDYASTAPTHSSKSKTTITFTKTIVNEEIPDEEFDVETLGVKPGDPVFNHITGVSDHYKTSRRPNPPAPPAGPKPPFPPTR
jgi:hypothetical protein